MLQFSSYQTEYRPSCPLARNFRQATVPGAMQFATSSQRSFKITICDLKHSRPQLAVPSAECVPAFSLDAGRSMLNVGCSSLLSAPKSPHILSKPRVSSSTVSESLEQSLLDLPSHGRLI